MAKPKKILVELIKAEDPLPLKDRPLDLLEEILAEEHFHLAPARIALVWKKGNKPDPDGRLILGKCIRLSDLQRELCPYDFAIELNHEFWNDPEVSRKKKQALLDHELCHAARAMDAEGDEAIDAKDRPVWRIRKHDLEEFREIVMRHGTWKSDIEKFAEALMARRDLPLLDQGEGKGDSLNIQ